MNSVTFDLKNLLSFRIKKEKVESFDETQVEKGKKP
jgi:hypothetical protein